MTEAVVEIKRSKDILEDIFVLILGLFFCENELPFYFDYFDEF